MRLDRLRHGDRFLAKLGLHHALVLARDARVGRRLGAGHVLAREYAAGERAVGNDADAVVVARGQDLDLGHAVHGVVVGLADDGPRHAQVSAGRDDLGNAPAS